jgi:L-fuculose-phosphate aldolase
MGSTFGTVSVRWRDNNFLITPRNISRWYLQNGDIVQIRDGMRESNKIPSQSTWLHYEIYRRNPGINSIIQTQSPYLMAFGVTHTNLDVRTIPESWILLQDIPSLPFGSHYYGRKDILELLSSETPAVLIRNDSVLITGDKLIQAFDRLEVAEITARSLILAKSIGKMVPINHQQLEDLRKVFLKK